ncbi:hypothetical protein OHC33_009323 [Knufia fluminis]|uniref:Uncharacterized protein n=1 Tax=Knufia fluminis TaxID=191047 RepID=A0AAN8ELY2_9EURO|nr:hypothetical protein OHC33_009323 [Knufia fluminis]
MSPNRADDDPSVLNGDDPTRLSESAAKPSPSRNPDGFQYQATETLNHHLTTKPIITNYTMDPFSVLGLPRTGATEADVKKAYHKLALENHPDKVGKSGEERMKQINEAYEKIMSTSLFNSTTTASSEPSEKTKKKKKSKSRSRKIYELPLPSPATLAKHLDFEMSGSFDTCYLCNGPCPDSKRSTYFNRDPDDLLQAACTFWMKCTHVGGIHAVCLAKYMVEVFPWSQACPLCDYDHESGDGTYFNWVQEHPAVYELYEICSELTEHELARLMMRPEVDDELIYGRRTPKETTEDNKHYPYERTPQQWRAVLTAEEYRVLREKGTETAFSGKHNQFQPQPGTYVCVGCNNPLFKAEHKFDSGHGWPAFFNAIPWALEYYTTDCRGSRPSTRLLCSNCGGHLGYMFSNWDYSNPEDQRLCVNSICLRFIPDPSACSSFIRDPIEEASEESSDFGLGELSISE